MLTSHCTFTPMMPADPSCGLCRYDIVLKQSVATTDVFLGMSGKDEASYSCEEMVVKIELPLVDAIQGGRARVGRVGRWARQGGCKRQVGRGSWAGRPGCVHAYMHLCFASLRFGSKMPLYAVCP